MRVLTLAAALAIASGCGASGSVIYPHPPGEPGTDPPPEITGVECGPPTSFCTEVAPGAGEALKPFALVTVRVTVDDVVDPPDRIGPTQIAFLHPPLGPISFGGRDRDLTIGMFADRASDRIGSAFFERDADALVGTWLVGMRRGSARRVHGRYTGTLGRFVLPVGRERDILIELVDFCYPTVRVGSRLHWSWLDGSGSPVTRQPAVTIGGCGG